MTPILLDMQAFGPYLHQTKIDFTGLGTDSLFLITGATGGGKTSILDAMSFALYCRATGGRRSWEEMRCDSASDDVSTFVEFQFRLGGEVYRFVRSRRVHFVRGSGRREFREEHYCKVLQWDPDFQRDMWRELESGSESQVRRYAEKLLGLTAEQFSQVIVLPQGDFLRLLRASSREKAEMLRTLFSMTEWVKIQNALGEQSKALEKQLSEADAARDAVLRQEGEETLSGLREKALRLEEEEKTLEEQARTAGEALQKAEQTLAARRELTRVRLTARQERENLSRWEEEGKKAEAALAEQKAAMEEVPHLREESRKEAARAARLEEELQQAQTLAQVGDRLRETEKALQTARAGVEQSQKARQEIVGRLETGEAFMKEVLAAVEKLPALREREANLARGEQAYQEWDAAREKARRQEKEVDTQKAACARLAVTARSLTESLSRQEALFRADRAAFLAAGLEEGEPCPVCGSRNHPAPACPGEGAMEKGELEELRRQENQARQAVSAGEGKLRALEAQWEQAKAESAQRETQAAAFGPREELARQRQSLAKELAEVQAMAGKRAAAQKRLDALQQELESARKQGEEALGRQKSLSARLEEQQARQKELLSRWQGEAPKPDSLRREWEQAQARSRTSSEKADALEKDWASLQSRAAGARASREEARLRWEQAEADCRQREAAWQGEIPPEEAVSQQYQEAKARLDGLNRGRGEKSQQKKSSAQAVKRLEALEEEFSGLQKQYCQAARLYKLLSGSNPRRVPMDKYVLSIMLEEILACANRFLTRFSRDRYTLWRSQERAAHNAYGGLDLVVLDGMTGHERSVDTLSGGEQFLASLSLALGLSETVQNQSGCVELEALFIDEGFGSLDQETLDTAMKALAMLHQGGRTIGIISHVSELRSRIGNRIEVSRLPDGSADAKVVAAE